MPFVKCEVAGGTARSVLRQVRQSPNRDAAAEFQPRLTSDLHGGCGATLTHGLMNGAPLAGRLTCRPPAAEHQPNECQPMQARFLCHCPAPKAVGELIPGCHSGNSPCRKWSVTLPNGFKISASSPPDGVVVKRDFKFGALLYDVSTVEKAGLLLTNNASSQSQGRDAD